MEWRVKGGREGGREEDGGGGGGQGVDERDGWDDCEGGMDGWTRRREKKGGEQRTEQSESQKKKKRCGKTVDCDCHACAMHEN